VCKVPLLHPPPALAAVVEARNPHLRFCGMQINKPLFVRRRRRVSVGVTATACLTGVGAAHYSDLWHLSSSSSVALPYMQ
jgi:hypothetical protein